MPVGSVTIPKPRLTEELKLTTLFDDSRIYLRVSEYPFKGQLRPFICTKNNVWMHQLELCDHKSISSGKKFQELADRGLIVWLNKEGQLERFSGLGTPIGAACQYILKVRDKPEQGDKPMSFSPSGSVVIDDSRVQKMKETLKSYASLFDTAPGAAATPAAMPAGAVVRPERKDSKTSSSAPIG